MRSQSAPRAERFETLYREHHGDVLRFTPRCADPATAEDVANETFAICWRRLDHVPRTAPLVRWQSPIHGPAGPLGRAGHRHPRRQVALAGDA